MSKQQELDKLAKQIITDKVCPELAAGATQLVMSDGSVAAEVVFIGEAPGKDEDIQGKPFVGAAGKFLTQMIESIGWKREDVYITNIVKYRPPDNRDPLPEEVQAFIPYLLKQLAIIKPKLVVTLGRFSMNVFMPELKISQVHGQVKKLGIRNWELETGKKKSEIKNQQSKMSLVVLPLYHPAAALYNGGMRKVLEADFMKIPTLLQQLGESKWSTVIFTLGRNWIANLPAGRQEFQSYLANYQIKSINL